MERAGCRIDDWRAADADLVSHVSTVWDRTITGGADGCSTDQTSKIGPPQQLILIAIQGKDNIVLRRDIEHVVQLASN